MQIPVKMNVEEEMITFVHSEQFPNFEKIMTQYAQGQFKALMDNKDLSSEDIKVARTVLEFYMKFPAYIQNKVRGIEARKTAEIASKIDAAQRYED